MRTALYSIQILTNDEKQVTVEISFKTLNRLKEPVKDEPLGSARCKSLPAQEQTVFQHVRIKAIFWIESDLSQLYTRIKLNRSVSQFYCKRVLISLSVAIGTYY
ncbi:Hypothetical_protein [Hexamita inflata]|uniref:Hypothetical_protein n=1 Tax=Hexamita inflata TaxID=28002 RepID=A0AA86R1L5_9EUKA|nr:Hypothetical protein HINF_LOCUS52151 [Hexamita inflata]CAI9964517.1 Hypothetical protein HINF_LOCUS52162 [Hexamita inflata]